MPLHITFKTDRFDLSGPLPEEINAGNQFYGEDLAKWLCEALPAWHLDYLDEDWGWYVFTRRDFEPRNEAHEICVNAYPAEESPGAADGSWMLVVQSHERRRWLPLLWKPISPDPRLVADLLAALRQIGVQELEMTDRPSEGKGP